MRFSVILRTAARLLVPLILLFSVFLLLRGHNETGGGFIGGLVAGISFALYAIAYGTAASRESLRARPQRLMAVGLGIAVLSGLLPLFGGGTLLEGIWVKWGGLKVGTPVLFDVGVYLLVIGLTLVIVYELEEHNPGLFPQSVAPE
ncbi:Na+/H+ antiporter subunit B [Salinibacter altiplanensis]|uniref:Na+/H+ antiporter subunit B n=1 Tax=Salinibacter altiplanensis TaxID=1803181 RepID=UPI000C9ECEAD|nr:Na+/H+ antiporter subunit B [Salinibacter altiplanensis]